MNTHVRSSTYMILMYPKLSEFKFIFKFSCILFGYFSDCYGQLDCGNGECISLSALCDNISDCPDGRDETNCSSKNIRIYHECDDGIENFVPRIID